MILLVLGQAAKLRLKFIEKYLTHDSIYEPYYITSPYASPNIE